MTLDRLEISIPSAATKYPLWVRVFFILALLVLALILKPEAKDVIISLFGLEVGPHRLFIFLLILFITWFLFIPRGPVSLILDSSGVRTSSGGGQAGYFAWSELADFKDTRGAVTLIAKNGAKIATLNFFHKNFSQALSFLLDASSFVYKPPELPFTAKVGGDSPWDLLYGFKATIFALVFGLVLAAATPFVSQTTVAGVFLALAFGVLFLIVVLSVLPGRLSLGPEQIEIKSPLRRTNIALRDIVGMSVNVQSQQVWFLVTFLLALEITMRDGTSVKLPNLGGQVFRLYQYIKCAAEGTPHH